MRFLKALALICGLALPAAAGQYFITPVTSTTTGAAYQAIAGQFYLAASSQSISSTTLNLPAKSSWTITLNGTTGLVSGIRGSYSNSVNVGTSNIVLDGAKGGVNASSFTAIYGVVAATASFSGSVTAGSFVGPVAAGSVDFSTITAAIALKATIGNTAQLDLSTVTTAIALKVNKVGDTMTGTLNGTDLVETYGVKSATAVFGSAGTVSTFSTTGALTLANNTAITLSGASGNFVGVASVTASAFFGNGSALSGVTGTATPISTRQIFKTPGINQTYTTAATARQIKARYCAGGGGGAGSASTGGNGGASSFGSVVASSGIGGATTGISGAGGSGGVGSAFGVFASSSVWCPAGNGGGATNDTANYVSGLGGGSAFGGGGGGTSKGNGIAGAANTGGGGGSVYNVADLTGGGGGQCCEVIINSPAGTYLYTVGVGGTAGTNAGAGGSGFLIVDEYY